MSWSATTDREAALRAAIAAGDDAGYLAALTTGPLLVPVDPREPVVGGVTRWATTVFDGVTHVVAFTSLGALEQSAGRVVPHRPVLMADLLNTWPDPSWWLAVNPGLPIGGRLPFAQLPAPRPRVTVSVMPPKPYAVGEADLAKAIADQDPDAFTAALLRTELHLPLDPAGSPSRDLTDPAFPWWRLPDSDGQPSVAVFTSEVRLQEALGSHDLGTHDHIVVNAYRLAGAWPDPQWTLVVNPGTELAASLPGAAFRALGDWLRELGSVIVDAAEQERRRLAAEQLAAGAMQAVPAPAGPAPWSQVLLPHAYVSAYLEQNYNRAAGLVHPWHGTGGETPVRLYRRLGVLGPGSPFRESDHLVAALRWRTDAVTPPLEPGTQAFVVPDGAEIYAIYADRPELLVARYDATTARWTHP